MAENGPSLSNMPRLWLALALAVGLALGALGMRMATPEAPPSPAGARAGAAVEPIAAATASPVAETADRFSGAELECHLGAVVASESADVAAEIDGLLETLEVRLGDSVDAGEALATLDTRALDHRLEAARADLAHARATERRFELAVRQAGDELARREALSDVLSREEQEEARFGRERADTELEAARAEVERVLARIAELEDALDRSTLRAPFDGRISRRYLDPGARVIAGTPVVRLIRRHAALVRFAVPPEAAPAFGPGTEVRLETREPRARLRAVVEQVAPEIDPASLLIFVEARIDSEAAAGDALASIPFGTESRVSREDAGERSCFDGR